MTIHGFLDAVEPFQIRGWVQDRSPDQAREAIKTLLGLSDVEASSILQAFLYDHPERTSDKRTASPDITNMGWQAEQMDCFQQHCAEILTAFGYSTDAGYFLAGDEVNGWFGSDDASLAIH